MLEGLDQVDWDRLTHAYGPASDVPDLLRALVTDDEQAREEALDSLFGTIWHQGTVYEATAYAVPFLIALLEEPAVPDKPSILYLLETLATGSSFLDAHQSLDSLYAQRGTPEFQAQMEKELGWVRAAHDAVVKGTPVYIRLLENPDPDTRSRASATLAVCLEQQGPVESALRRRLAVEPDPGVKAALITALGTLWGKVYAAGSPGVPLSQERRQFLAGLMRSPAERPPVHLAAAIALVTLTGEDFLEEALQTFHCCMAAAPEAFAGSPTPTPHSLFYAVTFALEELPEAALGWVFACARHPDPELRAAVTFAAREICRKWRRAPAIAAPRLAQMLSDDDEKVRFHATIALGSIGQAGRLAEPQLLAALQDSSDRVRERAAQALRRIRGEEGLCSENWPDKIASVDKPLPELLTLLEERLESHRWQGEPSSTSIIVTLGRLGPAAQAAIPLLRRALGGDFQWVRVLAARALWEIDRGQAETILPVLLGELRCRLAGIVAADLLGQMGALARPAVPALRRIIDSETRLPEIATTDEWVALDEAFSAAARQALDRIEKAASSPN